MKANAISPCVVTDKVDESKEFYGKHFGAEVTFDCGWYVNLKFGKDGSTIQFMAPQNSEQPKYGGAGLMYNFEVADVDQEYERLAGQGLKAVMPLEDHPWGDRGFAILDPNGIMLYIYSSREAREDFKKYFNRKGARSL
jgi:uncharacterized glyoxalase superfamily protein PhnB